MDYRILGPFEVADNGRSAALGGAQQRALLALLVIHRNHVLTTDRLIDELWGDRPPATAVKTLQGYISSLRKVLPANAILTRGRGYELVVEPDDVDVARFEHLITEGRRTLDAGDPALAKEQLSAALGLLRGEPLSDFAYQSFAQSEIARIEELHLSAVEDRVDADLALGEHAALIGELERLVREHPTRERPIGQLMLALYRSGRQADALERYRRTRDYLVGELGIEPGPELQALERAILNHDPALGSAPRRPHAHARRRISLALALGGALLVLAAVAATIELLGGRGSVSLASISADSVGVIDGGAGAVTSDVPLGSSPSSVSFGDGAVWVGHYNSGTVSRIDPRTRAVVDTIAVNATPSGIVAVPGGVWVAENFSGTVSRIDPGVGRVVQTIAVGNGPSGVAAGYGSIWVTNSSDGTLSRIDAVSGVPSKPIGLGGGATDVAVGAGAVWVSDAADDRVLRIDPQTDRATEPINVGNGPTAIAVGFGSVWVANSLDGTVSRINPHTNQVQGLIQVGNGPDAIAIGAGHVWVANEFAGTVSRIDPATDIGYSIEVGNRPQGVAIVRGSVWVGAGAAGTSHRGGTLTVLLSAPIGSLDPAQAYQPTGTSITNDGLTAFKRVGGSDGAQVVPDLATSLPAPTDGGTTYTFQVRRGVRYSTGAPVRPEDFRRAIERDFKIGDAIAPAYYADLVGGPGCVAQPARCDLSRGIVADDDAGTVTFHLLAPDPELLYRLAVWDAVAVPAGTPNHDVGLRPIAATGAYEIASATPREVRLVRNPYFHEWSRAARPDGYPDQILVKVGASPSAELTAVERGSADYTADGPPNDRLSEAQTRFASQLHINPSDVLDQLVLNTRLAPFNNLSVRRGLNYAVDRATIARLAGSAAQPTCQFLPPYIPGYKRYCPYTLDPNNTGLWRAPDLATAERLIAASHTRGTAITVWMLGIYGDPTGIGRYIVSLLDRLGYRARLKDLSSDPTSPGRFADSRTKVQVAISGYFPNYPRPSEFIQWFLSCQHFVPNSTYNANWAEFCDPRLDRQIRTALAAEGLNSPTVPNLWAAADRIVSHDAPLVPLVNPSIIDFVSSRVGNYQHNPQLGLLLDQLWVR